MIIRIAVFNAMMTRRRISIDVIICAVSISMIMMLLTSL